MPAADLVANVVVSGILTGLVYGLMALGLSVIFGVVRVVNFAHGEMMTIAMYAATVLFAALKLDPFVAMLPIAAASSLFGYSLQTGLINAIIPRPEHSQFMLTVAVAIILVNAPMMMIVIVGGLGSMGGALLGGVLIGVSEALAGLFIAPSAKSMFSFGLLILVLLLRPQGLLGRRP